ncbi:TetR/AcrR family transcriptional regulator [Microbacterium sp. CFH 31415]|uniref:TetR/AcrR family transcriptional regulator n=1 Tax=Microbacterium sp. CFH 31415 TaxID=2921732 RepID=UPI001F12F41E|nr:TetR/AcrR family transcriptional regulator [Microbacterium sp. CFH 31415]MCH6231611.1 TetR/AcrR family transcriptional regulator [Microbacterium sp. CFH 31415]
MALTKVTGTEQPSDRREQLLSIATRLIASRGYSATTVRDIADEAGILSGSLYHHFSSKEAILQEILSVFMDRLLTRFEEIAAEGGEPRDVLDRLIEHAFHTIEVDSATVALYQNESSFLSTQPGFEFVSAKSSRIERIWLGAIEDGQRAGVFRETIDAGVAYRFIRDSVWSTVRWFRPGGRHTAASVTQHFLDLIHFGLLAR